MNPIELGKFIANLRNEKNLTQEELAEKLFIDKRKISRWECGTSIPEFEMLIKLSEILDVSLYELSICKRITNEKLTKKAINKFKSLKDFKKYKFKRKLVYILQAIFLILFIITATYTIKYNDTVEIYQVKSMDENYNLDGVFITTKNYSLFQINQIDYLAVDNIDSHISFHDCEYEIYNNGIRKFYITNENVTKESLYIQKPFYEVDKKIKLNDIIDIKCVKNNRAKDTYLVKTKLINLYSNKIL